MNEVNFNIEFKKYEKEMKYLVDTWATDKYIRAYDLHEPEDILQEIHIAFWSACKTFKETKGDTFRTYWNNCVKNHMLDLKKHAERKVTGRTGEVVSQEGLEHVDEFEEAADTLNPTDRKKDVTRAVEDILNTDERNLYEFFFVQGRSMDDIAAILGTYKMDVSRQIKKLTSKPELAERLSAYQEEIE